MASQDIKLDDTKEQAPAEEKFTEDKVKNY